MSLSDFQEVLDSSTELINANRIQEALTSIIDQIEKEKEEWTSIRDIQKSLTQYILENILKNDKNIGNWIELFYRISLTDDMYKREFIFGVISRSDVDYDLEKNSDFIFSNIYDNSLKNHVNINQLVCDFIKFNSNKFELIKFFSSTILGEKLLEISLRYIIAENMLSIDELGELRLFFLETYNKKLFEIIDEKSGLVIKECMEPSLQLDDMSKTEKLKNCPTDVAYKLNKIAVQLKLGLGKINSSNDTAAKFILAAVKFDKEEYSYLPTLLRQEEIIDYFDLILKSKPPIRERFMTMGAHWLAGDVEIDKDGHVKIFIADSTGMDDEGKYYFSYMINSPEFQNLFINNTVDIYYSAQKRQNGGEGCSVYALDDVRHFYTMEKYMKNGNMFSNLDKSIIKTNAISSNINLKFCNLPDSLLRTIQSRSVKDKFQGEVVNKKGLQGIDSIKNDFRISSSTGKEQNSHLEVKFEKMTQRLDHRISIILESNNPKVNFDQFCELANEHTFAYFKIHQESKNKFQLVKEALLKIREPFVNESRENNSPKPRQDV